MALLSPYLEYPKKSDILYLALSYLFIIKFNLQIVRTLAAIVPISTLVLKVYNSKTKNR